MHQQKIADLQLVKSRIEALLAHATKRTIKAADIKEKAKLVLDLNNVPVDVITAIKYVCMHRTFKLIAEELDVALACVNMEIQKAKNEAAEAEHGLVQPKEDLVADAKAACATINSLIGRIDAGTISVAEVAEECRQLQQIKGITPCARAFLVHAVAAGEGASPAVQRSDLSAAAANIESEAHRLATGGKPKHKERRVVKTKGVEWTILSINERSCTVGGRNFFACRCSSKHDWFLLEHDYSTDAHMPMTEIGYLEYRLVTSILSLAVKHTVNNNIKLNFRENMRTPLAHLTKDATYEYACAIGYVPDRSDRRKAVEEPSFNEKVDGNQYFAGQRVPTPPVMPDEAIPF